MGLLQLGSFVFDMDDLPAQVDPGGQQLTATYQYPGGIKDVQVFGSFYDPITLTGTFNYSNAESKAAAIDKMYQSGGLYTFKVSNYKSLLVIITKYKPVFRSPVAIDYSIELEPLRDAPAAPPPAKKSGSSSSSHPAKPPTKTVAQPPKTNKPAPQRVYTVVKYDTLWGIAKKYYGSGTQYPKIMTANKLKSTLIRPGQRLVIP